MKTLPFKIRDYHDAYHFWDKSENLGLSGADSREGIKKYLKRNPGLSLIVRDRGAIVGTVLCGHDGRRGYLHHLAVASEYRGKGIGRSLVNTCLDALKAQDIRKCHIFIFQENRAGMDFWHSISWVKREDVEIYSHDIDFPGGGLDPFPDFHA